MWPSYLINLDKNEARLENSKRQFEQHALPFKRINAVNGWELGDDEIARVYNSDAASRRYKYPLIKPEIGCYLSHIEAWKQIAESGEDGGFIFEDDFEITSPLKPILEKLSEPDQFWDISKLFSIKADPKTISAQPLIEGYYLTTPYQVPTCLLGYAITADAAERLVDKSIPFFRPVDEDHKFFWENKLKVTLVHPSPLKVGDQQAQTGTIGNERKSGTRGSLPSRISRSFKSLYYQLNYKTLLFYHRKFGKSQ